jgi:hypothetical protein
VYDTVARAWLDIGDLSLSSRFEVEDPTRVLDGAGRMRVKVTGTGVPADMGQQSIFAGARISGVVGS